MKTQIYSTPSPISSPTMALGRETSQHSTPKTPPNVRVLSPPGAPRQCGLLHPEVTPQPNGAFRPSYNLRDRSNSRMCSPRPRRGPNSRNTRSRSPPRDRAPVYRNRLPVNDRLFGGRLAQLSLPKPFLMESIEQDTIVDSTQPSSSYNMNEQFQRMLSLADTERQEQVSGTKSSALPNNETVQKKAKKNRSVASKFIQNSSDEECRLWSKKS
ncbi:hypothetical protein EAE96_007127 [Botrytis aclada]|nr:hypothetical protein EAE96_007127 [Botrytis aclada]